MTDPRRKKPVPLCLEQLETREAPSVTPLSQSFDTTPIGQLPAGWQQWSSQQPTFLTSSEKAHSPARSLKSATSTAQVAARAWHEAVEPADVEVSAAVFADNSMPVHLLARGVNLNTATPSYYAAQVLRGLDLRVARVVNGVQTTLATVKSTTTLEPSWVRVTLLTSGTTLRAMAYRMDTAQYLDPTGRWVGSRVWAITLTDSTLTGPGRTGFARPAHQAGTFYLDDFRVFGPEGDVQKPTVNVTYPPAATWLSGQQTFRAQASDNVAVSKVEFLVNGAVRFTDLTAPYEWTWATQTAVNGAHTLTVRATDVSGNTAEHSIPVLTWNADALAVPQIPQHYSHIRIAQLAYGTGQIGAFEEALLRSSVDLVVTQGGSTTGQIAAVSPSTPQLIYTNISTLYQNLLTDYLHYADARGRAREGAFYHVTRATAYSGTSPSSQPVNWFWGVLRDGSSWRNYTVNSRGGAPLYTFFGDQGESVYIGFPEKFREINLDLLLGAGNGWRAQLEYASAVDAAGRPTEWKFLGKTGDSTNNFTQSGRITWDPRADWKTASVNGSSRMFWVRFRTVQGGVAPIARSVLGRDYTNARGTNTGVIPTFDSDADADGDGYLNDAEWVRRAAGKDARFLYESRALYGNYGQMRFATNPSYLGFREWVADYLRRLLTDQPAAVGLFIDNSMAHAPVPAGSVRESVASYSHDFATLINQVARTIQPRWVLANTGSDEVISTNTAYYDEFALRPLAHNYLQFESVATRLNDRLMLRTPPPYAVLDSHPTGGSPTDPRTQMATLAYYYLLQDPTRTFLNFFGGFEPSTSWTRHWVQAAAYNVGQPVGTWREFATGRDPADAAKTYRVYARTYTNALVLYKPLSYGAGASGTLAAATATTHHLGGTYRILRSDGTLGETVTGITLRNGEGVVLIKV